MEEHTNLITNNTSEPKDPQEKKKYEIRAWHWVAVGVFALFMVMQVFEIHIEATPRIWKGKGGGAADVSEEQNKKSVFEDYSMLKNEVIPEEGITIPVRWGDLGMRMVAMGVIDEKKFTDLYIERGGLDEDTKRLLSDFQNGEIKMNAQNSGIILNLLWGLGLANKNPILEEGPMVDAQYGGDASRFASTGGWTLAKGNAMDHYSNHQLLHLTSDQQKRVEAVSRGVYRPCCGNATYFPDCNHGMAMLGLLELLASRGVSEEEMYRVALGVNAYWFPDTYLTIAAYFKKRGVGWQDVDPKEILGSAYSSAAGYRGIRSQVEPPQSSGGGACGV